MIYRLIILLALAMGSNAAAETNRIDLIRHDAPELADYGPHDIGVRTLELVNVEQPDVVHSTTNGGVQYYDRRITAEFWYPAILESGQAPGGAYTSTTRNHHITAVLHGRAVRDALPAASLRSLPLVVISHGYPGNRYLMSHLGEILASKGYVVVAPDHPESTYRDQGSIASSMYNRPLDQIFIIDQMAALSSDQAGEFAGMIDSDNTAIVGYSVGGYGLIVNIGGGYNDATAYSDFAPIEPLGKRHAASNPKYHEQLDKRIKAAIAIAPWGMANGVWNAADLANIKTPTMYMSGSIDRVSGYELGTRAMFESATNSERYLLTFLQASHSAIAPIPLPIEIHNSNDRQGADHYTDPVWDSVRSSNVMTHFATAFLDVYLKKQKEKRDYLTLVERAEDSVYSMDDGEPTEQHTFWKGFPRYTARGLVLEFREAAAQSPAQ